MPSPKAIAYLDQTCTDLLGAPGCQEFHHEYEGQINFAAATMREAFPELSPELIGQVLMIGFSVVKNARNHLETSEMYPLQAGVDLVLAAAVDLAQPNRP
jgi:hypothetical protein